MNNILTYYIEHLAECRGPKWHTEVSVIAKQILLDSVLAWSA